MLELFKKGSWMTDYRKYRADNRELVSGSEFMYKGLFFLMHTFLLVPLSVIVGVMLTFTQFFLNGTNLLLDNFILNSIYILLMMFISLNGVMLLNELMILLRKSIL